MTKPKKQTTSASTLLEALKFCSLVTKDDGAINETHLTIANHQMVAFNGIFAAGCPVKETIQACPHSKLMRAAITKCGQDISLNVNGLMIEVQSGKFKAKVPCIDMSIAPWINGDKKLAILNDDFMKALAVASLIPDDNSNRVVTNSILLNAFSVISTDGKMLFEAWHGVDMPRGWPLPKEAVQSLIKITKKLVGFGWSRNSITFWFEDDSWFRTQLSAGSWPPISHILEVKCDPKPIPADFWIGLKAVAPFAETGRVWFLSGHIASLPDLNAGASYDLGELPEGLTFSVKQLAILEGLATHADFKTIIPLQGSPDYPSLYFTGPNIRGVITGFAK